MLRIEWAGQEFELHAEKAAYWPARRTLLIADPHFGKAAAFQEAGLPVPAATEADTARLTGVLRATRAQRLIVLGDLLHAQAAQGEATATVLSRWRRRHRRLEVVLVAGNHDRKAGVPPADLGIRTIAEPLVEPPLAFRHELAQHDGEFVMAGHVHPGVLLHDMDGSTLRVACFWFGQRAALLPAFGSFTGSHAVRPRASDRVYAVGPDAVVQVGG